MASSSELSDVEVSDGASRRKSGRVVKQPERLTRSSPPGGAKRKRADQDDEDVDTADDASDDELSEGEPDEEELREKRRKASKSKKPPRKPAAKKPKTNGATASLAIRPASGRPKTATRKPKKPRKTKPLQDDAAQEVGGLYAEVFAGGEDLDSVADAWIQRFAEDEPEAIADLVNFVLRCSGYQKTIDEHDVEDQEGVTSKLADMQDEYQAQNVTEYPLIAKGKGAAAFKTSLAGFFDSLVKNIAKSGLLFDRIELMENIEIWVSTMSSAQSRPFRHTATIVSLAIVSALCQVGREMAENIAKTLRQSETEQKKARVNKGRTNALEDKVKETRTRQDLLDSIIKDWVDTVFVHRYRDVDPRIRVDCVQALGDWIMTYPEKFFDGNHLRYIGWVLSDTNATTRLEAVKQLQKLFADKDKLGGLKTFTERFRGRMVEMSTRDAEAHVRASAVELLDLLREAGLLEPDDIDSVGRLIFDSEPRVRKAVVGFFAQNINDLYESKIEELGGQDAVDEAFPPNEEDADSEGPGLAWLRTKCLVEALQAYDSENRELPSQIERGSGSSGDFLLAFDTESRISLAAEAMYDEVPQLKDWEVLAGYLLFDHSQSTEDGAAGSIETLLRQECKLSDKEEIILLEVLNATVRLNMKHAVEGSTDKRSKKTKKRKEDLLQLRETAARHLAVFIPRLLKKFGATPEAATAVLRLEPFLNLEVFQELRQDSSAYSALLDDINKQFLTHGSEDVLHEASLALLHAKTYEELGEVTESKVQNLWEDTMDTFYSLTRGKDVTVRGSFSNAVLTVLTNTVLRIANLASISDCTEPLETAPSTSSRPNQKSRETSTSDAVSILTDIVKRGIPNADIMTEVNSREDHVVSSAARSLQFYFMWRVRSLQEAITAGRAIPFADLERLAERRDAFVAALSAAIKARRAPADLRLAVAGTLLDLHALFATLRTLRARQGQSEDYLALVQEVPSDVQVALRRILASAEKAFARKTKRSLETAAEDDDPADTDEEPASDPADSDDEESDDEDADGAAAKREQRMQAALVAERRLCELASKL
ncbi:cohesin complex subunit, partial [Cryomyces antarcticus]